MLITSEWKIYSNNTKIAVESEMKKKKLFELVFFLRIKTQAEVNIKS